MVRTIRTTWTNRPWLLILAAALLLGLAAFGWWTLSPLVLDRTAQAPAPVSAEATILQVGEFVGADRFHQAAGNASLLETETGLQLRFDEGFRVTNGPDLFVWLVPEAGERRDFVDLGALQGNVGAQGYEVPAGVDLERYDTVVVWCRAFGVLFGSAVLQ